jgi:nitrous oxidase accessory protein
VKLRAAIAAVGLAAVSASAAARVWKVGGAGADFPLIAPAIAAASDGDTVEVRSGVYREDLVLERRVALVGRGWPVLVGTGEGTVVELRADGCAVSGLSIEGSGTGLTNRLDAGILVASNRNRVAGNRLQRVFYGVVVQGARGNEISGNRISGLSDLPFGHRGDGIFLYRSPGNRVSDNSVEGMRDAIYLQYSPRTAVLRNAVAQSRYGLHDMFSDDATIRGNVFSRCSVGANVMNSRRIEISGNRFEKNRGVSGIGLALKECDGSRVLDNQVLDNGRGLQVEGSSRNRFAGNRFSFNDVAVHLFPSAEENVFAGNVIESNLSALVLQGSTTTTRFEEAGRGNYWSGYAGFDFDGDGVGERPHAVLGAFEKIEGGNPAARLYLQSPAARALELAQRAFPESAEPIVDPAPLTRAPAPAPVPRGETRRAAGLTAGLFALALAHVASRKVRPCSRS